MAEQIVVTIFRTGEKDGTFVSAYFISFFNNRATIQGVSSTVTFACRAELKDYFISKNMKEIEYVRIKKGVVRKVIKSVR